MNISDDCMFWWELGNSCQDYHQPNCGDMNGDSDECRTDENAASVAEIRKYFTLSTSENISVFNGEDN